MENLIIEGTKRTPQINFDYEAGVLEFIGRFIPENPSITMGPIMDWLKNYSDKPQKKTIINFYIEYFNTSNSKRVLEFLKMTSAIENTTINWYHEEDDEDMLELGEDFQIMLGGDFNVIGVDFDAWKDKMPYDKN